MNADLKRFLEHHALLGWLTSVVLLAVTVVYLKLRQRAGIEPSFVQVGFLIASMFVFAGLSLYTQRRYKEKLPERWRDAFFQRSLLGFLVGLLLASGRLILALTGVESNFFLFFVTVAGAVLLVGGTLCVVYYILKTQSL